MGKEISIVIKAYNQTKRAFAEVGKGLKDIFKGDLGKGFGEIGKGFAKGAKDIEKGFSRGFKDILRGNFSRGFDKIWTGIARGAQDIGPGLKKGFASIFQFGSIRAGLGHLVTGFKQFGATTLGIASKVGVGLAKVAGYAAAAGAAVVAVGKKALDAYKAEAQADAKLEQALKNSGYAAGYTATELKKMSEDLMKVTGVEHEATQGAMAFLAASGDIRGDNFTRAARAALDMGVALQKAGAEEGGVESAARTLAKALESPEEGLAKLTRAGVYFTDSQEKQIKEMAKAGDLAGAQAVILAEVERRYKGAAEAAHKQTAAQDDLRNALGEAAAQIGQAINESQGFKDIIAAVSAAVQTLAESGKIELWAQNVATAMAAVGKAVLPVVKLFGWIGDKVRDVAAFAGGFVGAQGGIGDRMKAGHQAMIDAPAQEQAALDKIKAEKAAKEAAKQAEEKAAMEAAKGDVAARDAAKEKARLDAAAAEAEKKAAKEREEAAERELKLAKEIADERERIAKTAAEIEQSAIESRWQKQADQAGKAADEIGAALERREAMGAPGSKAFRKAEQEQRRQAKKDRDFWAARGQVKRILPLTNEDLAAMNAGQRDAELRRVKVMQRLGLNSEADSTPEAIAARAKKLGVHLSKRDVEAIRRAEALDQIRNAKAQAAVAQANIEGARQAKQAADIAAMKDELKAHNQKLDELLRAG